MTRTHQSKIVASIAVVSALLLATHALAVNPATITQGRQLFERNWPAGNPALGSDGLGPLFNGQSCVACHHQGGIGGGGDSRFNAKTIGIESIRITGSVDNDVIARMVASFHPGFVQPDGSVVNTFTMAHHGGSSMFQQNNAAIMSQVPAQFSSSGGSANPSEVRQSYATPVMFNQRVGDNEIFLRARLFQRNTTSLFGAGLIDAVDEDDIEMQFKAQKQHPEISGRPSTLSDGRVGKFGWRANVASLLDFVDQACANEVGLETRRKPQGIDPTNRGYRNPAVDITDDQIRAMKEFIAALPAPVRKIPDDSQQRIMAARGEQMFASVGCAVCHVPNLGPATGIYSDLLLHEMGYESIDLNHAEPYVVRRTPIVQVNYDKVTLTRTTTPMGAYYGGTTSIQRDVESSRGPSLNTRRGLSFRGRGFVFETPKYPQRLMNIIDLGSETLSNSLERTSNAGPDGRVDDSTVRRSTQSRTTVTRDMHLRVHYERTNFNEEWRTPPLWGLADSAPYMHDGRAETLLEAISMHDGEASGTRDRFLQLPLADRHAILAFLETLVAPQNVPQPAI